MMILALNTTTTTPTEFQGMALDWNENLIMMIHIHRFVAELCQKAMKMRKQAS
jgi:hypothetical protein